MKKTRFSQLEMFDIDNEYSVSSDSNTLHIKKHEKVILLVLSFLAFGIISYCWGFKEGKRTASLNINYRLNTNTNISSNLEKESSREIDIKTLPVNLESGNENNAPIYPKKVKENIKEEIKEKPNYTIQVATYRTLNFAEKEAEKLKKKGFTTMIINKGNYILLCVGSFFNRQEAEMVLAKLKKNYGDCFIRRF